MSFSKMYICVHSWHNAVSILCEKVEVSLCRGEKSFSSSLSLLSFALPRNPKRNHFEGNQHHSSIGNHVDKLDHYKGRQVFDIKLRQLRRSSYYS